MININVLVVCINKKSRFNGFFQTVDKMVPGAMHPEPF